MKRHVAHFLTLALSLLLGLCLFQPVLAGDYPTKKELVLEAKEQIRQVDVAQAKVLFESKGHLFIDCREPEEYAQGHIPGAMNIPRGLLEFKIAKAVPDTNADLVLYCKTGGRGCLSTLAIQGMGYLNTVNMDGGWKAWAAAGYPVEVGASAK